jgi:hypothetical protein
VIIAGVGEGPYKREITLPIPTPDGLLQWSVPSYERRAQAVGDVELSLVGGSQSVRTVVIEDVSVVAKENLDDRLLLLSAKSAVRAVLKRELTQQLEKEADWIGRLAGDLFTLVTERADLRSWQTLPDTWQGARAFVPPGTHALILQARGGERVELARSSSPRARRCSSWRAPSERGCTRTSRAGEARAGGVEPMKIPVLTALLLATVPLAAGCRSTGSASAQPEPIRGQRADGRRQPPCWASSSCAIRAWSRRPRAAWPSSILINSSRRSCASPTTSSGSTPAPRASKCLPQLWYPAELRPGASLHVRAPAPGPAAQSFRLIAQRRRRSIAEPATNLESTPHGESKPDPSTLPTRRPAPVPRCLQLDPLRRSPSRRDRQRRLGLGRPAAVLPPRWPSR